MTYDFAIVGAGIAGLSAAARLSELGSVIVLEREDAPAYHASGRSAALYEKGYGNPSVCALTAAGEAEFEGIENLLSPRGFLILGQSGDKERFTAVASDLNAEPITLAEAHDMVPILDPDVVGLTAYEPDARDLDTDLLIQHYQRIARANGATVMCKADVQAIHRGEGAHNWRLITPQGEITARAMVNAAGAWADQLAIMAGVAPIGLQPYRRSIARVQGPDDVPVGHWPMLYSCEENWYAKAVAGNLLISPCEEHPMDPFDAYADDMVLAEGIAAFDTYMRFEVRRLLATWAGLRSFAPDRTLVLGPDKQAPSFIWCAGQGGYGFQTAAGASRVLADRVAGRASDLGSDIVASVDPARF